LCVEHIFFEDQCSDQVVDQQIHNTVRISVLL